MLDYISDAKNGLPRWGEKKKENWLAGFFLNPVWLKYASAFYN